MKKLSQIAVFVRLNNFVNMGKRNNLARFVMVVSMEMSNKLVRTVAEVNFVTMENLKHLVKTVVEIDFVNMESSSMPAENVGTVFVNTGRINSNAENVEPGIVFMEDNLLPVWIVCQLKKQLQRE